MRRLFALFVCVLFTACASPLPLQDGRLNPPAGQGMVLLSLTGQANYLMGASLSLDITGPAPQQLITRLGTDMIQAPGSEENPAGKLFALTLPAGEYRTSQVRGSFIVVGVHAGETRYVTLPLNTDFRVAAGQVVYLGNVNVALNFASTLRLSNTAARDFYDLKQRDGVTDTRNILIEPLRVAQ
ncbi:hypothetical protein [uncultured Deefgea sp.]|uniref:hypothetical protein n=1 Tax=uncultured Deefgea sp. TaxID=1304914 RepID=UPI00259862FB|nr:hypothetical protein [uncultured Deefgea sp.]